MRCVREKKGADSQEEAIKCVVDHHHAPFEQIQIIGIGFLYLRNMSARTYAQFSRTSITLGLVESVERTILRDSR